MNREITMDDYILTNIDHKTGCFTIRLKDNKEYMVWHKIENGKTINFIEKDGDKILLSDDVVKAHLSAVREYQVSGI